MPEIMGEKEFFDVMKNANRFLTGEERYQISVVVKTHMERRKDDRNR